MSTKTNLYKKARIYFQNGMVEVFDNPTTAYTVYITLPGSVRAAFRGAWDSRPIESWDYI